MSAKAKRRSVWAIWSIVLVALLVVVFWDITSTVAQKQSQFIIGSLNELSSKQNSIVGICQSTDPDLGGLQAPLDATLSYAQVDSITRLAVQRAGGFGPVIEANDWVLIKVNMIAVPGVQCNWTWSQQGTCTDLRVGKSVIEQLIELDIPLHITVAEGGTWRKLGEPNCPPEQTEDGWTVHWSHYGNLSWEDMTAELDTFPNITVDYMDLNYSSQSPYTERPVPGGGGSQSSYYIPDAIVNCDKVIAIPAMKTHGLARVTLSNKLYVGISPAEVYNQAYWSHMGVPHSGAEPDQIEKTIVDLMSYHPPDFVLIPCFWGLEGAGPTKAGEGKSLKGTSIKRNLVIAGRDPVAVDAATVRAMGRNPYDIETLYLANQEGFGNWRLDKIDVAGPSLEEVAYDWAMPARNGLSYYQGRGNRTWLINGTYSGIDVDYDYLGGEAGVSPVEGDSSGGLEWTAVGWTNMRDYCDLAAYFGSPSNCISYAFTRIIADSAQTAYLRLGADDGIKVWLNGVIEYLNNNTGSWSMIQNYPGVQINLQEGVNDLLVKVKNEGGAYGFSLYISESDGDTPLGTKYSILAPDAPVVELEYPANGASTTNDSMELAATVTDPDGDSMTVWIYGDTSDASDLLYVQENVASGSYITYNWTAPVLTADTSTIGLWHFDEGSGDTLYDASPYGNHGTIFDATWTAGRFGSALHFDGVDDYVRVPDSPSLNPTSAISIELWTYREDNRSWSKMLSKPYGLGAWPPPLYVTYGLAMQTRGSDVGNLVEFPISINGQPIGMAPEGNSYGTVPLFEWHYIAVTFDGQYHRIYIDGQLDREEFTPGTIDSGYYPPSDLFIGSAQPDLSVGGYYLGSLDEVRISNRARTAQEIADAYQLGVGNYAWKVRASDGTNETSSETRQFSVLATAPDTLPPTITLNRPPNDSTTTNSSMELSTTVSDPDGSPMTLWIYGDQNPDPTNLVYQESGLSSPSTVTYLWGSLPQELEVDVNTSGLWHFNENTGTTAYDETANDNDGTISGATWTTGRFGSALSFDGSNDYVQVADASSLDITGDLTLEAWIKPDALTADHAIITKRDAGGTCNYQMYLNSDNEGLSFYAGGATEYQSSLIPTIGQWSYVAIVRSGTTLDFYLDDQTAQMSGPAILTANSQPVQIGSRSVGSLPEAFDGTMDEVRITNRALTPQEIAANYSSELAGGRYYWNGIVSDGVNEDTSETRFFDVVAPSPDTLPPVITLNSPDSASSTTADSAELSATVDDPEGNPMTVWFYGDQNPDPTTLLYQESDVSDPSTVTYLWGGSPQELQVEANTAGLWHFNENTGTTASDETANDNDGTISGATWTTGRFGSGLSFDGVDDYVQMSDAASLDITDSLTIEAWVKFESIQSDWRVIVGKVNTTLAQSNYHLSKSNTNTIHFGFNDGTWHTYSSALTVSAGQWYYLAATYSDPNDTVRIYVNGVLDTAYACQYSLLTNDLPLRIGRNNNDQEALNATIDEIRITNRTLTAGEIAANYSSELSEGRYYWKVAASDGSNADTSQVWFFDVVGDILPPVITLNSPDSASTTTADSAELSATVDDPEGNPMTVWFYGDQNPDPTNLVYQESGLSSPSTVTYLWDSLSQELEVDVNTSGLWHFNENTGTTAYDETANDNDGTISGATWTTGRFGSALSFDGSNDYVQVPAALSLDITGDLTLEAWIKPDALTGSISIVTKRDDGGTCNYQMYLNGTTQGLSFYAGGATEYRSTLVPTVGQWSYVAIVRSGTTLNFYLDDQTAQMAGPTSLTTNSQPVQIGARSLGNPEAFDGTIDEVRITNRALTAGEIAGNYSSELAEGRYYWKVAASDGSNADTSQVWFFDVVTELPPDVPTLINPPDLALINDNTPTFDWSSTAGSGGAYTLQYALDAGFTTGVQTITDIAEITYTVPAPDSLSDNTYFWHVQAFNSVGDSSGYQTTPFSFTIDREAPDPPTDFVVEPGHEKCKLSWTNPTGDPSFEGVEIRRNPWEIGAYPEYDDDFPTPIGYPTDETEGDLVYQGSEESFRDSSDTGTMPRNVYYYSIFSYDSAGNYSTLAVDDTARATNYWLGDVTGDGYVYYEDLTIFSNAFRTSPGEPGYDPEFDIGPTYSMSPKGIPTTDDLIEFEDLVIFAINYAAVDPNLKIAPLFADQDISGPLALSLVMPTTDLELGKEFEVKVLLRNNPGTVKSMHLVLPYDPSQLEFVRVDRSEGLKGAPCPVFFDGRDIDCHVDVSLALLGGKVSIGGSGEIASIVFRLLEKRDLSFSFSLIDLRDGENHKLLADQEAAEYEAVSQLPSAYELSQNYPNPYNPQTQIAYQLPQAGEVSLRIYNIRGELVRTLVAEYEPAGYHTVLWDGRNQDGMEVSSGIYFYRMVSGEFSATKKMVMIK